MGAVSTYRRSIGGMGMLPYPTRNLMLHLDTQQGAANFANSGATWLDLSGNNRHAAVPVGWAMPQLVTDPANGLRSLRMATPSSGFKSRFALPATAFIFCVANVATLPTSPDYSDLTTLWDEIDNSLRYSIYLNRNTFKIAKGGNYGDYAHMGPGLFTLAWDGLLLARGNTDFVGTGIGNPQQLVGGLTIGNEASGQLAADAYFHLFLVYSDRPTDAEILTLVQAAKRNYRIPA